MQDFISKLSQALSGRHIQHFTFGGIAAMKNTMMKNLNKSMREYGEMLRVIGC